ncbi:DUF2634 domain-containing protein [Clostridium sp.]|uniref:DUF2634 domain-containing protein n=1 Tax=Clostridium sp. TaxID=1506 RepID=UPI00321718C2
MIPEGNLGDLLLDIDAKTITYGSTTYGIDWITKTIPGYIDELEALKQSILCILQTERYDNLIYSYDYGTEFQDLIGEDVLYVKADIHRRIEEALLQDDRIISLENPEIKIVGENLYYTCKVNTIYGELDINKEVKY